MTEGQTSSAAGLGGAVLVHGLWGNPEDWQWVKRLLSDTGIQVQVPDLPTHRSSRATLADDADEVRSAIRSCPAPVVAVGWSYGGKVISMAALEDPSVIRLVYVSDIPRLPDRVGEDDTWVDDHPHISALSDGMFVLDNDWWVDEEAGTTFPAAVQQYCRDHPRRPAARTALTDPQTSAAWETIETTVILGTSDELLSDRDRRWAARHIRDVHHLETDHFILFREPGAIADAVIRAINGGAS